MWSFEFKYADPEKNFDRSRVVGTVASNFTMADAEGTHAVALEAGHAVVHGGPGDTEAAREGRGAQAGVLAQGGDDAIIQRI